MKMPLIILILVCVLLVSSDTQNAQCIQCQELISADTIEAIKARAVNKVMQPIILELDSLERLKTTLKEEVDMIRKPRYKYKYDTLCSVQYKDDTLTTNKAVRVRRYILIPRIGWEFDKAFTKKLN